MCVIMKQNSNNAIPGLELSTNLQAVTYDKVYWQYITLSKLITQVISNVHENNLKINHCKTYNSENLLELISMDLNVYK